MGAQTSPPVLAPRWEPGAAEAAVRELHLCSCWASILVGETVNK